MTEPAPAILLINTRAEPDYPDPTKVLGLPLAILTLARELLPHGYDVRLLDENVVERTERRLDAVPAPLFVGISCLGGGQIPSGLAAARLCKRRWPDVPVVWGGWSPTMLPALYEDDAVADVVDVVVRGRGERPVVTVAERLAAGRDLADVPGVSWRDADGRLQRNPDQGGGTADNGEALPYYLLERDWDRYLTAFGTLNVLSAWGCPHRCAYCGIPTQTQTFAAMDNGRLMDELAAVPALGIHEIVFFDDNFLTVPERVLDLARRLEAADLGLTWHSNARLDQLSRLSDDELALLQRSGCRSINIGYETGDQVVADTVRKDVDCDAVFEVARRLAAHDLGLSINVMIGLPGETEERLVASLETLFAIHAAHPRVEVCWYMFMPAPRTPAWDELVAAGKLTEPRSLAEHMQLQTMYLEHPWYYENPPRSVLRDDRTRLKAIAWCFYQAYAAPPPVRRWLRPFFALRRRLCRWRFEQRRFGLPLIWRAHFVVNVLRTRVRWGLARLGRRPGFDRVRARHAERQRRTRIPGVRPV